MTVNILVGTFVGVGIVLFVISYFAVEGKKEVTEAQKKDWYKKILVPWIVFAFAGFFGAFLMHEEYSSSLEDTICIRKNRAHLWLKPEKIPFRWRENE